MSEKIPKAMQAKYEEIITLTDAICHEHLNEEYAALARKLTAKLSRKRPSPLTRGQAKSWACGIVYALGQVNFLFDKSFEPYIAAADLCAAFGVSSGTGGGKAKAVRDAVGNMSYFDADWQLSSRVAENPMVWMISVDGFIMDARNAPISLQVEAYQKGLIPYVPNMDMEMLDALIKEHGYVRIVEAPIDDDDL